MAAETWVLLRGLAREARHWEDFPGRLAAALGGPAPLTPDLPGAGRRFQEPAPLSVPGLAAAVREEVLGGGARTPVSLLGLSLGGMVAVAWAQRWPGEVDALVTVNTSLGRYAAPWRRLRPGILGLVARAAGARSAEHRERALLAMIAQNLPDPDCLARRWGEYQRQCPVSLANIARQTLAAARYRGPAQPPPVRGLVLRSLGDRMVSPGCSERLAAAWGWPLASHPWGGHDLPLEDPDWCVEQVAAWRAGRATGGSDAILAGS